MSNPEGDAVREGRTAPRWAVAAAAVAVLLAALAAVPVPATALRQASGDEPHYLVTAQSLARDGDLDVANQLAADSYRAFHAPPLGPQGRAQAGGRVVEPHDPLLPALLALPLAAGGWPAAKATLALLAAAVAAVVMAALTRRPSPGLARPGVAAPTRGSASPGLALPAGAAPPRGSASPGLALPAVGARTRGWEAPGRALLAVCALLATAPFAVYGAQVYPEVPAALAVAVGLAALLGPPSPWRAASATAAVVALPWLSVKHVPVAAVLAVGLLAGRWRAGRGRQALAVAAVLVAAGVAYVVAHLAWYGGVTVYAAGGFFAAHGGEASVLGTDPDLLGRATRLVGLLVDRDFGLAAWQPAWLLVVPAAAAWVRRRPPGWAVVAGVLAAGWLNATFLAATMHGYWFPGRHVVAVLPAAVLVVGWWVAGSARRATALGVLAVGGVVAYGALLAAAAAGEATAIFFAGTPGRVWTLLLPDYPRAAGVDWLLHGAWVAAACALAVLGWRGAARSRA